MRGLNIEQKHKQQRHMSKMRGPETHSSLPVALVLTVISICAFVMKLQTSVHCKELSTFNALAATFRPVRKHAA